MTKVEKLVFVQYDGKNYKPVTSYSASDHKARLDGIHEVEKRLAKMRGGLVNYFKSNPDNIIVKTL